MRCKSFEDRINLVIGLRLKCRGQRFKAGRLVRSIYNNPGEPWEVLAREMEVVREDGSRGLGLFFS